MENSLNGVDSYYVFSPYTFHIASVHIRYQALTYAYLLLAGADSQTGDANSSRAQSLTSCFQGDRCIHCFFFACTTVTVHFLSHCASLACLEVLSQYQPSNYFKKSV